MTRKTLAVISVVLVAAMMIAALIAGAQLPAGTQLPVHWNVQGEPDRYAGKWIALFGPPLVTALVSFLFYYLPRLEPRKQGFERSLALYAWGWVSLLMIGAVLMLIALSTAFGWGLPIVQIITGAVGLMFILMGNQMGKSRSMYMVGFRTPWTLASEEVWIKTHRLSGKLMVGGGLIVIGAALAQMAEPAMAVLVVAIIATVALVPAVYSYILWRRETA